MRHHRGEPGVIYPEGGRYLDTADDDDRDAVVEFWRKHMERLGLLGRWSIAAVPAPVSRASGGRWFIKLFEESDG